jgi:hypothetical protein
MMLPASLWGSIFRQQKQLKPIWKRDGTTANSTVFQWHPIVHQGKILDYRQLQKASDLSRLMMKKPSSLEYTRSNSNKSINGSLLLTILGKSIAIRVTLLNG